MAAAGTRSGASLWASCASSKRLVGVGILERLGLCRQQHRAAASGGRLVDDVLAARDFERMQCGGPILRAALQLEKGFDRPAELGVALQRPLGELAGRFVLALALGFEEQAAQAELLGLGRGEHGFEDAPRGGAVAADLGGLRAQQVREGLMRQRLARLGRIADGECAVAGADGDDAAGERIEPALLTAAIEIAAHRRGAAPGLAQERPRRKGKREHDRKDDERAKHAGLGDVAEPFDGDGARPVGKPVQSDR